MQISNNNVIHKFLIVTSIYLLFFYLYFCIFFIKNGYLPSPFFYIKSDMFMDFFNVNWMALQADIYTEIKTFYSPLNLVIAKNLVSMECLNAKNGHDIRICDINYAIIVFILIFLLNTILILKILRDVQYKYLWLITLSLCFPYATAIERGNYILIAATLVSIMILSKFKNRLLLIPLVIQFKIYLIIILLPYLIQKKVKFLFLTSIITLMWYIVFGFILGSNNWYLIINNIFLTQQNYSNWYEIFFNTTNLFSYIGLFSHFNFKNIYQIEFILIIIKFLLFIRFIIFLNESPINCNEGNGFSYISLISLTFLLITLSSPGYYAVTLLIPFFADSLRFSNLSSLSKIYFLLLMLPYPMSVININNQDFNLSFSEEIVNINLGVPLQSIVTPIILLLLFFDLTNKRISNE
jgi:hypothetical protein